MFEAGDARERRLDGKGDEPFHVLHRKRRLDDIDLHLIIGDIRHRINGQLPERPRANEGKHEGDDDHEMAVGD